MGPQQGEPGSLDNQNGCGLPGSNRVSMVPAARVSMDPQQQNQPLNAQQRSEQFLAGGAAERELQCGCPPGAQRTEVRQLAPEIDWSYAVIQRLDPVTLKTTLIPFDLGKLVLDHDSSQDLELQAGDVVSIFSEADIHVPIAQQTKLVTLSGEFVHAGVYSVQPGETFRQLVERAGGLTPNAYLYGSEYTRVSTRIMQQARIDEYVQNLSMEIQRSNMAVAASAAEWPERGRYSCGAGERAKPAHQSQADSGYRENRAGLQSRQQRNEQPAGDRDARR